MIYGGTGERQALVYHCVTIVVL